jgi:hypothetical protein
MSAARLRRIARVLDLLRRAIPADDLDEYDWSCLRVSVRLVYETEDLGASLQTKGFNDRYFAISYWIESMESGLEFMSWVKALTRIVTERVYAKERRQRSIGKLWEQHHALAQRLSSPKMSPGLRMSLLVELAGIELSLLGHFWWLEASNEEITSRNRLGGTRSK